MPNYSLVSNSVFQPFTYQELAAPLDRQEAYQENLEQQYEQLSDKADILEAMGKNDRDKKVYGQYKAYSDALRNEADNLYRYGLNSESRMRLTDLRRRYNQEIVPIQNAWNKREQEAQMQLQASMNNPMLRFTRDARDTGLDYYIDNPMGGFGAVNLTTVSAMMSNMAKNLAKQIRAGNNEGVDEFTFNHITKYGLDPNLINQWINNPDSNPTLTNMLNQVLAANGLTAEMLQNNPKGAALIGEATKAAQMGAWDAVGEDKEHILENFGKRKALEHSYAIDMENRKFAHDLALKQAPSYSDLKAESGALGGGGEGSLFPFQQGTLPIAVANGDIEKEVLNNAAVFGGTKNKKSQNGINFGNIYINPSDAQGAAGTPLKYIRPIEISLFDNTGRAKKYREFMSEVQKKVTDLRTSNGQRLSQADMQKVVNLAGRQFSNAYNTARKLGIDTKFQYTRSDIATALQKQRDTGAAGYINGYNWNHKNNDWNSSMQIMPVQEIAKTDHNGKMAFKKDQYTLADLLNTGKDAKINENGQDVHAFITNMKGQEGVIFTVGNRQFFTSYNALAGINRNAWQAFNMLKIADQKSAAMNAAKNAGDEYEAYTSGQEASNAISSALSLLDQGFGASAASSSYNMWDQPTSKQNEVFDNK